MTDDSSPYICIPDLSKAFVLGKSGVMTIPYGEVSFTELKSIYRNMISAAEDKDFFLLDGMTLMADLRAALLECRKTKKPVWAIIPVDEYLMTEHELPCDAALITLQSLGIDCFGISSDNEENLIDAIARIKPCSRVPLAVKAIDGKLSEETIEKLLSMGVEKFIGLEDKALFEKILQKDITPLSFDEIESIMLANERQAFFLEPDTTEISEGFTCSAGMDEELIEAENSGFDVIKIVIDAPDDVLVFIENAHLTELPIMFSCNNETELRLALMLYQGRAIIDSTSPMDEDEIKAAAEKYGAVIY